MWQRIVGTALALIGIASLYMRFERGWHWIFTCLGVWGIFGGGIIVGERLNILGERIWKD